MMIRRIKIITLTLTLGAALLGSGSIALSAADERYQADQRGQTTGPIGQGIYSRPVWKKSGKGTYLGGYIDFEYRDEERKSKHFDQKRLIPFIYADIAPGLRFATEIEFEHGGSDNNQTDGEVKVEFAFVDYELLNERLTFRGGILLSPLGKFNLIHDSPINDLTDRPMVNRFIIPTTLSESGAGIFGSFYPDPMKLDYELYIVNGFDGGADGSAITVAKGLRDARGSQKSNNNDKQSLVGRLGISPFLGSELGFSFHSGAYDDSGNHHLTILAADAGFQWRFLELTGEYANAQLEHGTNIASSTVPHRMEGFFVQLNIHFLQDVLRQGSTFTGVVRAELLDTDVGNRISGALLNEKKRLTLGLNFRPVEDTVFKLDYQFNFEASEHRHIENDAFILSLATYF